MNKLITTIGNKSLILSKNNLHQLTKHIADNKPKKKNLLWFETLWSWADVNNIDEDILPRNIATLLKLTKIIISNKTIVIAQFILHSLVRNQARIKSKKNIKKIAYLGAQSYLC